MTSGENHLRELLDDERLDTEVQAAGVLQIGEAARGLLRQGEASNELDHRGFADRALEGLAVPIRPVRRTLPRSVVYVTSVGRCSGSNAREGSVRGRRSRGHPQSQAGARVPESWPALVPAGAGHTASN